LGKFLSWKIKVTISEKRSFLGIFLAFDKHMNIVLADCDEYLRVKTKSGQDKELKRHLGLIILRGENVLSITVDSPPLPQPKVPIFKTAPGVATATPGPRFSTAPPLPPVGLGGAVKTQFPAPMGFGAPPPPPPPL
jgi:small nuclear ribonucleoprotein B and B'